MNVLPSRTAVVAMQELQEPTGHHTSRRLLSTPGAGAAASSQNATRSLQNLLGLVVGSLAKAQGGLYANYDYQQYGSANNSLLW